MRYRVRSVALLASSLSVFFVPNSTFALEVSVHDFPPFVQKLPSGEAGGPFRTMVDDICREMNQTCVVTVVPNRRSKFQVDQGEVDVGFPYGWTEKRSQIYYYSVPFMVSEYGLFVSFDNKRVVKGIEDLQDYQVAAFTPSNTLISLEGIRDEMITKGLAPLRIFKKSDANGQLVQMLASDRIASYYSNRALVEFRAKQFGVSGLRYAWSHKPVTYFAVFPKAHTDSEQVRQFNQAALKVFSQEGYLLDVLSPWSIDSPKLDDSTLDQFNVIR
ncbi:transporter substrate-binding domain-containing protein [Vibrio makurazakiensis]|uniref:substrate-binding periplasmic protein n=1 Tax=Vibrio makurazakiensis TaxID=2910250 RepID=UPI003D0D9F10